MNEQLGRASEQTELLTLSRDWKFRQKGDREWLPAKVPGCVHTDLLANHKIDDPFDGINELELQWIDKQDWEYEITFDLPKKMLDYSHLELVFDGLDTYASVFLNDVPIIEANNMFRVWKKDVNSLLKHEENRLKVYFHSPVNEDIGKLEEHGFGLPATNDHSEDGGIGDKKISVFARKAPYHYGWDWGPRFVTSGIWKDVKIKGWSECQITDLYIQHKNITQSLAELTAKLEVESDNSWEGQLVISTDGMQLEKNVQLVPGKNEVEVDFEMENPKLWWSRGLGDQHFYEFTATVVKQGIVVGERITRTGLRSIELVRKNDSYGSTFYLELNGVPVFAKGANHIPNDSFVTEVSYDRYNHEILSAVESNMNMLRVWGGGIYEYDTFYDLCDEYGIMVWQDFMFACSMYPGDASFLQNVKIEAEENIKRLRNHPSVVLWCGNNEIDGAWSNYVESAGWGWKQHYSKEQREQIWQAYEAVFHQILPDAVEKLAPMEPYWPSSPMSDWTRDEEQHASLKTGKGDIHYWEVWHGKEPFEAYQSNVGRFMSEYGFQSFPELKTVKTYAKKEDLELESEVMLHHQKHDEGNQLIKVYMDKYCPTPKDFPSFLYMSQVLQGEGIKTAIEAHRRHMPYCMGSLYWQMNDCWPVASWSSMDYYGRWKALHYYVKRSFKDVLLSIEEKEKELNLYVVSDKRQLFDGELQVKLLNFEGRTLLEQTVSTEVEANSSKVVMTVNKKEWLKGFDPDKVVIVSFLTKGKEVIDIKEHYFVPSKHLKLTKPEIKISEVKESDGRSFVLSADVLAKQVRLSSETEGFFTDNYFDLIPGIPKPVRFITRESSEHSITKSENVDVCSMFDFIEES
ncbi:beta-mannosidase [Aquibacillus albus]|uniref:Beta-mannosidase n=1 Tax=Aquibacillus albus TaxID=1168171 RepID=A0ABS2N5D8_9BACI|nr:glycoside hydrolase family 2 protein [Aquibacillus albus]MBM7573342.1 beta-mannosidase [Aquibacillus albus]